MMRKRKHRPKHLSIGEASELTGLTQRTLRFYEEKGLLHPPTRLVSGIRLYTDEDIYRLRLIRQLRENLGFSLADIKGMTEAEEIQASLKTSFRSTAPAQLLSKIQEAIAVTELQLNAINQKIGRLSDMRSAWQQKVDRYRHELEKSEL